MDAPKSSLFPIIHTLLQRRFLSIEPHTARYKIGVKTFAVGSSYLETQTAVSFIREEMTKIVATCSETCHLGILDQSDVLYIAKVDSPQPIRMISSVGKKLPAYATALGKALLCDFTLAQLKKLYPQGLKKLTTHTIDDFELLFQQLQKGYSTQIFRECEEATEHIQCSAVPLHACGEIVASLSVAIPVFRAEKDTVTAIEALLISAQQRIETFFQETGSSLKNISSEK